MSDNNKVLLIDDDESVRLILSYTFKNAGFHVEQANDGEDGLNKIKSFCPDFIITDLLMPVKSGIELVKTVRLDLQLNTPIIVVSSAGMDKIVMTAFELGVNDFVQKPFKPKQLVDRITKIKSRKWVNS